MKQTINKLEILEKIHLLSDKTRNVLFEMIKYAKNGYFFAICQRLTQEQSEDLPYLMYFIESAASSIGKLSREGFIVKDVTSLGTIYYEVSPILEMITEEDYEKYITHIKILKDILKEHEVAKDHPEDWLGLIRGVGGALEDFKRRKQRNKDKKKKFSLNDTVSFYVRGTKKIGSIIKLNSTRAKVFLDNGEKWTCTYNSLSPSSKHTTQIV